MKYKFKNKTAEPQSINLTNGSAIIVSPREEIIIDNWNIYKEEMERLTNFFDVSLERLVPDLEPETIEIQKTEPEPLQVKEKPKKVYTRKKAEPVKDEDIIEEDTDNFDTEVL
jgi:hypothetical protein